MRALEAALLILAAEARATKARLFRLMLAGVRLVSGGLCSQG
jgi:hypothetical protein